MYLKTVMFVGAVHDDATVGDDGGAECWIDVLKKNTCQELYRVSNTDIQNQEVARQVFFFGDCVHLFHGCSHECERRGALSPGASCSQSKNLF